jgi:hypothetical protein
MWRKNQAESQKLHETRDHLTRTRTRLVSLYCGAVEGNHKRRMNYLNKKLQETGETLASLAEIETELLAQKSDGRRFVVSSLFLHECFEELTLDSNEQFHFVTGCEIGGLMILDQRCGFEHVSRTAAGVEGELKSTHRLLCRLEQFGLRLLAHSHSHPGHGIGATMPSPTDRAFQERLERGGYPTVGAIFSRDGFIRFFRLDHDFELEVHGKGVEEIEPNVFRLTHLG